MKKASVDDYIKNILNSSSLDNEMKLSFQRKKAANNQQSSEKPGLTNHPTATGKFGPQVGTSPPLWATNESYIPALFQIVCNQVLKENGHLDTNAIYKFFLSSGLPNAVLGLVWNSVNRTLPGELLPYELNLGLALIAVIQHQMRQGLCNNPQWKMPTIDQLCLLKDPPIPQLSVPMPQPVGIPQFPSPYVSTAPPAQTPTTPISSCVSTEPDLPPPTYEMAVSMMTTAASGTQKVTKEEDDFGDFASSRIPPSNSSTPPNWQPPSSQSGSSRNMASVAPPPPQSDGDFFSTPVPNTESSSDWADFSSFKSACNAASQPATTNTMIKAPPLTLPLKSSVTSSATHSNKITPTLSAKSFSTEEVELAPSVEKHETVDRYASLRDELAEFDQSSSGSDEITTSPSGCDPASISSSRSSTNNDIHWINTHQSHTNKMSAATSKVDDDDFTDFRAALPAADSQSTPGTHWMSSPPNLHAQCHSSVTPVDEFGEFKQSGAPATQSVTPTAATFETCFDGGGGGHEHTTAAPNSFPTTKSETTYSSNISALNSMISAISTHDSDKKAMNSNQFELIDSIFKSVTITAPSSTIVQKDGDGDEFGSFSSVKLESSTDTTASRKDTAHPVNEMGPSLSSVNRYDLMKEENICEAYELEWCRCLESCESRLQEAHILFAEMINRGLIDEVLDSKKGNIYMQGLSEIYSVSLRINQAQSTFDVVNSKLHEKFESIKNMWIALIDKCPKLAIDLNESLSSILPHKSMTDCELCGVCLNSISTSPKLSPSVLSYGARHYHCSCANFWVNNLDLTLPQLTKPHLI